MQTCPTEASLSADANAQATIRLLSNESSGVTAAEAQANIGAALLLSIAEAFDSVDATAAWFAQNCENKKMADFDPTGGTEVACLNKNNQTAFSYACVPSAFKL